MIFFELSIFIRFLTYYLGKLALHQLMATKADQEGEPEAKGGEVLTMFGIYFCSRCRNMMTPHRSEDRKLIFKCQTCGLKEV